MKTCNRRLPLVCAAAAAMTCTGAQPGHVLDQVIDVATSSQRDHLRSILPWVSCGPTPEEGADSLCTGERADAWVSFTIFRGHLTGVQAVTDDPQALVAWADHKFGSKVGGCTLDSAGVRTEVGHWRASDGTLVVVATGTHPPADLLTLVIQGKGPLACPTSAHSLPPNKRLKLAARIRY